MFPDLTQTEASLLYHGAFSFYLVTLSHNDTVPFSKLPESLVRPLWETPLSKEYVPFAVNMEAADFIEALVCSNKPRWITLHNTIRSREEYVYNTTFKNVSARSRK